MSLEDLTQTPAVTAAGWTLIGSSDITAQPHPSAVSAGGRIWGLECGYLNPTVIVSDDGLNWTGNAALPFRSGAAACAHDAALYVSGGLDPDEKETSEVFRCVDGVTWTRVQAPWPARSRHCMVSYQGKLVLFGGRAGDGLYFQDMWTSPDGVTWTNEGTAPDIMISYSGAVVNGQVCVVGAGNDPVQWFNGQAWRPDTQPWSGTTQSHPMAVLNSRLYVLIGRGKGSNRNELWSSGGPGNWRPESQPPWAGDRTTPGFAALGGTLVVFGGYTPDGVNSRDIYSFTPAA